MAEEPVKPTSTDPEAKPIEASEPKTAVPATTPPSATSSTPELDNKTPDETKNETPVETKSEGTTPTEPVTKEAETTQTSTKPEVKVEDKTKKEVVKKAKKFGFWKKTPPPEIEVPPEIEGKIVEMTQTREMARLIQKELFEENEFWTLRFKKRKVVVILGIMLILMWMLPMARWFLSR